MIIDLMQQKYFGDVIVSKNICIFFRYDFKILWCTSKILVLSQLTIRSPPPHPVSDYIHMTKSRTKIVQSTYSEYCKIDMKNTVNPLQENFTGCYHAFACKLYNHFQHIFLFPRRLVDDGIELSGHLVEVIDIIAQKLNFTSVISAYFMFSYVNFTSQGSPHLQTQLQDGSRLSSLIFPFYLLLSSDYSAGFS